MKNAIVVIIFIGFALVFWSGCEKDPVGPDLLPQLPTGITKGVYVLNEGNFGDPGGARLSLYDYERDTVLTNVFEAANAGAHLGSLGDDLAISGGKLYVLMSGSNEIRVLNLPDHRELLTRTFSNTIHDMAIDSARNRLYVTELYNNAVLVLSADSLIQISRIPVGLNPQGMLVEGNNLFVCNSGYGADSTVSMIDLTTLSIAWKPVVSRGPAGIGRGADGRVIVTCAGDTSVGGSVWALVPLTRTVNRVAAFTGNLWGRMACDVSGNAFVIGVTPSSYYGGPIHKVRLADGAITSNFDSTGVFYSIAYNPYTDEIVAGDALSFTGNGRITIRKPNGTLRRTFAAQTGPGTFAFLWR